MAQFNNSSAPLPQGFSVYQPQLGAQLQFFPALGSQELDDMMNAYLPGPATTKEKRATISLDFLEHIQMTGQSFKFYPVFSTNSVAASPATSSVSSFNVSPSNSTWDWNHITGSSASSRSSTQSRRQSKASTSSPSSRHPTTDFSHLPGMKIMTKDGQDVTNSASRGSKTKEQRDHAHLMRIIKACDSCRRKKIRCDPSHRKRVAAQAAQSQSSAKIAKKARTSTPHSKLKMATTPPPLDDALSISASPLGLDPTFTFAGLESMDSTALAFEPQWEEFVQYPVTETEENYDFFFDPSGYLSSQSSASSTSASPGKAATPPQQDQYAVTAPGLVCDEHSSKGSALQLPFLDDQPGSLSNYTDFNLFSPESSFSEDERMISVASSGVISPSQPSVMEEYPTSVYSGLESEGAVTDWSEMSDSVSPMDITSAPGAHANMEWYDPGRYPGRAFRRGTGGSGISPTEIEITCPPDGTVIVTAGGRTSDLHGGMPNVSTQSSDISGSVSIAIHGSDKSGGNANGVSASNIVQTHRDTTHGEEVYRSMASTGRFGARASPAQDKAQSLSGESRTEIQSPLQTVPQPQMAPAGQSDYSPGLQPTVVTESVDFLITNRADVHPPAASSSMIATITERISRSAAYGAYYNAAAQPQDQTDSFAQLGIRAATSSVSQRTVISPTRPPVPRGIPILQTPADNTARSPCATPQPSAATGSASASSVASSVGALLSTSAIQSTVLPKQLVGLPRLVGSKLERSQQGTEVFIEANVSFNGPQPTYLGSSEASPSMSMPVCLVFVMVLVSGMFVSSVGPSLFMSVASLFLAMRTAYHDVVSSAVNLMAQDTESLFSVASSRKTITLSKQSAFQRLQSLHVSSWETLLSTIRQGLARRVSGRRGGILSTSVITPFLG